MPFLVDSVNAELVRQNAPIHLVMHPLFVVTRNRESGELVKVARVPSHLGISSGDTAAMPNLSHLIAQGDNASHMESWIAVEIDRVDDAKRAALVEGIARVLDDVRAAVEDWPKMRHEGPCRSPRISTSWPTRRRSPSSARPRTCSAGSMTGTSRSSATASTTSRTNPARTCWNSGRRAASACCAAEPTPRTRSSTSPRPDGRRPAKSARWSSPRPTPAPPCTAPAYLDYIGVKSFDAAGNVNGERRFIGLFATTAYAGSVRDIPVVREKVAAVLQRRRLPAGLALRQGPAGHPRDLPARRALPDRNPGPRRHRDRHPAAAGTPPDPALPPPGHLRPFHVRPRLPAA